MSEEQLKAFLEKVNADTSLQEKLKAAKSPEDVVTIAKEYGHEFTADKMTELSERELEHMSGGDIWTQIISVCVSDQTCGNGCGCTADHCVA